MAGSITVSSITLDSDNNFSIKSNTGATLFFANTSGVDIANSIGATAITSDKILSIANTKISGNIISSQITSIGGSQITANTIANSAIQTGAVENYMNAAGLGFGMRNRIINGAMVIDQRNAGAAVTAAGAYTLDRWMAHETTDGAYTVEQSSTAPTGFNYSIKATVTTADASIGASQNALITQYIEGYNTADLGFGTANAKTVTISFWVNSSVTGTFTGTLQNSAADRSYPFSYTINSANTWEQKSITIAGDTSGTWIGATNGVGLRVWFALAAGSSLVTTAGAWAAGTYYGATGQANWMATLSNTFYITGVQLEKGSTATSFDYRPYGTELALCQRYYEVIAPVQTSFLISVNATAGSQEFEFLVKYLVLKRVTATVTRVGTWTDSNCSGVTPVVVGSDLFCLAMFSSGSGRCYTYNTGSGSCFTVSAEL
jgi:hypothetical protein